MRVHGFSPGGPAPLFLFRDDTPLKAHAAYKCAKSGDAAAAVRLVEALAHPLAERARDMFQPGLIYVAPHSREASGDNAIPQVLAQAVANLVDGVADGEIVQATRVFHTGADPMERLNNRAAFDGQVVAGASYVLVDDVMTMGGTLAELAHHIKSNGGAVAGIMVLANASRTGRLVPDRKLTAELESRYGEAIREIFRIDPGAITADEARYLIGFRTVDEIRNRSAKARQETNLRLRAKGLRGVGGEAG